MPIAAGVIGDQLHATLIALLHMAAKIGCATAHNRTGHFQMGKGHFKTGAILADVFTENVCDLHAVAAGPANVHPRWGDPTGLSTYRIDPNCPGG